MRKRVFLTHSAVLGLLCAGDARPATVARRGPDLLTVSGDVGKANRGPLDPVRDQMMARHGITFQRAYRFDAPALWQLRSVSIRPTLEYDGKPHVLAGPTIESVLQAAGVEPGAAVQLGLRAVDGYNVVVSQQDARSYRMIVATHIDGEPLALGGLGPQWAVYDADRLAAFKDKPLKERFGLCPWGLYHIGVRTL